MLIQTDRLDEAFAHLTKAIALWPYSVSAQHHMATLLLRRGDMDEAISHFAEVVRLTPQSADVHFDLAEALRQRGQIEQAAGEYREALRLNPGHEAARAGLALLATTRPSRPIGNHGIPAGEH
jgi:Tfp pilus assembly protein PilF